MATTVPMQSRLETLQRHNNAVETLRQRVRSRYPILSDGTIVAVDGRLGGDWIARGMVDQALRAICGVPETIHSAPEPLRIHSPAELRDLIGQLDQTTLRSYGTQAEIMLMEVGPRRLHAYWHVPKPLLAAARAGLGDAGERATAVVRLHDVTDLRFDGTHSHYTFDTEVALEEERRYIELWSPDKDYLAEFGLRTEDGRFTVLARSNRVHVPRDIPGDTPARRINVESNVRARVRPSLPEHFRLHEPRIIVPGDEQDWPLRDLESERRIRAVYREFLRDGSRALRLHPPLFRPDNDTLEAAYERRCREREEKKAAEESAEPTDSRSTVVAFRVDTRQDETPAPQRNGKPKLPTVSRMRRPSLQDLGREERAQEIGRLTSMFTRERMEARLSPLSLPEPGASESRTPDVAKRQVRRLRKPIRVNRVDRLIESLEDAGVELEAELVLRGRVKPGKKVRIGGRIIETQPDGSFVVRCVVRDGKLHVPVEVVEADVVTCRQEVNLNLGTPKRPSD